MNEREIPDGLGVNTDIQFSGDQDAVLHPTDKVKVDKSKREVGKHQTPPQVREGTWEAA